MTRLRHARARAALRWFRIRVECFPFFCWASTFPCPNWVDCLDDRPAERIFGRRICPRSWLHLRPFPPLRADGWRPAIEFRCLIAICIWRDKKNDQYSSWIDQQLQQLHSRDSNSQAIRLFGSTVATIGCCGWGWQWSNATSIHLVPCGAWPTQGMYSNWPVIGVTLKTQTEAKTAETKLFGMLSECSCLPSGTNSAPHWASSKWVFPPSTTIGARLPGCCLASAEMIISYSSTGGCLGLAHVARLAIKRGLFWQGVRSFNRTECQ